MIRPRLMERWDVGNVWEVEVAAVGSEATADYDDPATGNLYIQQPGAGAQFGVLLL